MSGYAPAHNPFATRFVRPGAVPFVFELGQSADGLIDRLRASGWWGQVVGPHGSGKSTLVAGLLPALARAGRAPFLVALHDGQRRLPVAAWETVRHLTSGAVLIIDGYEQLSHWDRFRIKRCCRRRGLGLLVTAHEGVGLPEVARVTTTPAAAVRVVRHLLGGAAPLFAADEIVSRLAARRGNMREALFDLYDLYEQHRNVESGHPVQGVS